MTIFQLYDHTPYLRATTLLYVLLFDCSSRLSIDLERSYALWSVQIGFTIAIAEKNKNNGTKFMSDRKVFPRNV